MRFEDAADAERIGLEVFVHAWMTPEDAADLRAFTMERYADELAEALGKRRRGDRSDVWAEVRRLGSWIATIDDDVLSRMRRAAWEQIN